MQRKNARRENESTDDFSKSAQRENDSIGDASTFSLSRESGSPDLLSRKRGARESAKTLSEMAGLRATIPIWIPAFAGKAGDYFLMLLFCAVSSYASRNSKQTTAGKPMNFDTTPKNADDPKVMELLAKIRRVGGGILSDARPFYVPVIPDPSSEVNECFVNVSEKIAKDGGESIVGWTIRKETMLMSAEFHSIWKSPTGKLLDITPREDAPTSRILFVSAPEKVYEGKWVNNIDLNISENPLMDDYIACREAIFNITNRGERAHQRKITRSMLSTAEENVLQLLEVSRAILLSYARAGCKTKNSPCFCGSGKKFKFCCGEGVREALESARDFM